MEAAVATDPQADAAANRRVFGEPAGTDAEAAIGMQFLAHDQFQNAVGGNRSNRVFAHGQRHEGIDQGLCVQAHQVAAVFRQLTAGEGLLQRLRETLVFNRGATVDPQAIEEVLDRPRAVARQYFHQVTGQPTASGGRGQAEQIDGRTAAARVELLAAGQGPVVVARCLPGVHRRLTGQQAKLLLPVTQGVRVAAVDLHRGEQGLAAVFAEPVVQAPGKTTEVLVLAVTEAEYCIVQAFQAQAAAQYLAFETAGAVRRFAIAEGADHEQCVV
ncbi:hypothetical protein D3C87_1237650 [compost metagenome]